MTGSSQLDIKGATWKERDINTNSHPIRRLTKSRFKIGLDCPTKLFYASNQEYPDNRTDDSFMAALAAGGYQVGELAKCYYPVGVDIETLDPDAAVAETLDLLQADSITLFEAAVKHENLLVRIDILVKTDKHFDLIEVKAKSVNPEKPAFMQNCTHNTWPLNGCGLTTTKDRI